MKNIFIAAVLFIPILFLSLVGGDGKEIPPVVELPTKPWITITKGEVSGLKSGDSLDYPITLVVSTDGEAKVHFLDGSVLRLDSGTTITLNDGNYDKASGAISVKVSLAVGKVWSKVIDLATPASVWEVKTSNAVATVRGTAFGMSSEGGHSKMFGSQHTVALQVIDPKTGERVGKEPIILSEGKFVEWTNDDVEKIRVNKKVVVAVDVAVSPASAGAGIVPRDQEWLNANESEDTKIEVQVKDLKSRGVLREKLREELLKDSLREVRTELKTKINIKTEERRVGEIVERKITEPVKKAEVRAEVRAEIKKEILNNVEQRIDSPIGGIIRSRRGTPVDLIIESRTFINSDFAEQQKIAFRAMLVLSDGSKEDVTSSVDWRVVGPIGTIDASGIFVGKLTPEISEMGEGSGVVMAIWKGGDKELAGKTPVFRVLLKFEDDGERRG
ncbi:MAG: FecR family protein [bacterium]|nr:FecR family protein [bacterium]